MSKMRDVIRRGKQREAFAEAVNVEKLSTNALNSPAAKQGGQTAVLSQSVKEYQAQLAKLTQALHDQNVHIGNLEHAAALHTGQIEAFTRTVLEKDVLIHQLHIRASQLSHSLSRVHASLGWKLFKPVRILRTLSTRFSRRLHVDLVPLRGVETNNNNWSSISTSIQFLLTANNGWHRYTGWYWLNMDSVSEKPMEIQLCFDMGEGFASSQGIGFTLAGKGRQQIPLFVPRDCRAIRINADSAPSIFKLDLRGLMKPKGEMKNLQGFRKQLVSYEALGGRQGNLSCLLPINGIQLHNKGDYCWCSVSDDPWFTLQPSNLKLHSGWYTIELSIHSEIKFGNAKLYFDYGNGFDESASVTLPFTNGREAKRLYRVTGIPKKIRFDPFETATQFSVERLHCSPVTKKSARKQMLRFLFENQSRHQDTSVKHIWSELRAYAKRTNVSTEDLLYKRYNESFLRQLGSAFEYANWIDTIERCDHLSMQNKMAEETFQHRQTISIIVPTYNTPEAFLRRAIESVLAQSYVEWELCVADDASSEPHVRQVLEEYAKLDPRIKVIFREKNGHISEASNSALTLATGHYVALMDHDDELAQHALLFVMEAIHKNPYAQIFYSDEDKIDEHGNRSQPHFKSDWNPDLFFSQNYVSHLGVYRRELLQQIGGFRIGVEGSQDQDLLLRCLLTVESTEIIHIPRVLYHWRIVDGSTAQAPDEKKYTTLAGIEALRHYFDAQGRDDIKVEAGVLPNTYRVTYPLAQPEPLVSLLIPTRDALEVLELCIKSILAKTTYRNYEIIILDNESSKFATLDYFERIQAKHSNIRVVPYHSPFNFSAINNFGVELAKGEVIGLINNDVEVITPEWLTEMTSHALRPEIGCVGAKLYYRDESIQHAGVIVGVGGVAGHSHKYYRRSSPGYFGRLQLVQNLSAVTAACLLVRKQVYNEVGGLEENGLRVAFNDVDFCLKVREAGYRNLWTPHAELFHYESKSRGAEDTPEKKARFKGEIEFIKNKWGEQLQRDPYYSEHLTLAREDFSIGA
jgi:glycosyltransferase involved in cell wall biosynthesis